MQRLRRTSGDAVRRSLAGEVPVFHVAAEGPTQGALMFRVGRGDEALPATGITHLVEHLSLFPFGQQPFGYNGFVDPIRTVFVASGKPDEVRDFLAGVCRNLANLPLDRLSTEERVLRDEGNRRSISPFEHHAWLRWGYRGPGLAFSRELGLWRLQRSEVQGWASTWFTAANAAVVWVGSKVPALNLELPSGIRKSAPDLVDLIDTPVWAAGGADNISVSFRVERGSAEAALQRVLAKRLQQRLRYDHGLSYDVSMHYQPVSSAHALSTLSATCGSRDVMAVRDVVVKTMLQLQRDGPTSEELLADLDAMRRSQDHPLARQAEADRRAIQELLGAEPDTRASLEEELAAVTPELGRLAFGRAMANVILTQPGGMAAPIDWPKSYPNLINRTFTGATFSNYGDSPLQLNHRYPTLVVGEEGVAIVARNGSAIGIAFDHVAAVVQHSAGPLQVLHGNGSEIGIEPTWWRGGKRAIELVIAKVSADRVVYVEDPPGTLPAKRPRSAWTPRRAWLLILFTLMFFTFMRLLGANQQTQNLIPRETIPPGFFQSFFPRPF